MAIFLVLHIFVTHLKPISLYLSLRNLLPDPITTRFVLFICEPTSFLLYFLIPHISDIMKYFYLTYFT